MKSPIEMGKIIRKARKDKNLSIEELADMVEKSSITLGRIERGNYFPSIETYNRICNKLGLNFIIDIESESDDSKKKPEILLLEEYMPLLDERYQEFAIKRMKEMFENMLEMQSYNNKGKR